MNRNDCLHPPAFGRLQQFNWFLECYRCLQAFHCASHINATTSRSRNLFLFILNSFLGREKINLLIFISDKLNAADAVDTAVTVIFHCGVSAIEWNVITLVTQSKFSLVIAYDSLKQEWMNLCIYTLQSVCIVGRCGNDWYYQLRTNKYVKWSFRTHCACRLASDLIGTIVSILKWLDIIRRLDNRFIATFVVEECN